MIEFRLPELGESVEQAEITSILVAPGDRVTKDQSLLEIATDKAAMELPSPEDGIIEAIHVAVGDIVTAGALLATLRSADQPASAASAEGAPSPSPSQRAEELVASQPTHTGKAKTTLHVDAVLAGPATRRLARELGVDLALVKGSGGHGRILEDDVKAFVREKVAGRAVEGHPSVEAFAPAMPELPDFSKWGPVERQPLRSVRKKTAEHMGRAWAQVPHVTHHDEADVTLLDALRNVFREQVDAAGGKLTLMPFLLKAVTQTLQEYPHFNASLDVARQELVVKRYYHIGVAVDTDRGLLVPVVRDVNQKGILALATELTQLAERTRNAQVKLEELQGGTFTITNLGGIGGAAFTPIVNFPEVAILGVSRAKLAPVARAAQGKTMFDARLVLPLSLSYDHRVIDGSDAARFMRRLVDQLENPGAFVELR